MSKCNPQQKMLRDIATKVKAYNIMYGKSDADRIHLETILESNVRNARVLGYGEQYSADVACLALNQEFGFGPERLKRFCERYKVIYQTFVKLEDADRKADDDLVYSEAKFEEAMKACAGQYYIDRKERYRIDITFDGKVVCAK